MSNSNNDNNKDLNKNDSFDDTVAMDASENDKLWDDAGKIHIEEGRPWGVGIIEDIKRTVGTHWLEEMKNFNQKTVAVTLLMFISVMAPTLSFGAVYGKETDNRIGAVETILATTWVGVTHSLIGGMPMTIIGSTGPVLAFTKAVVSIADSIGVPFVTFQAWISCWLLFYCCTAAFFDLTRVVRLATRFTDEIFAFLIVSIFVLDAVGDPFSQVGILRYFNPEHKSHDDFEDDADYNYLEVAFLSTLLGFGTTALIFFFRYFKTSSFCCNDGVRSSIHDFAVTMAVIIMTVVNEFLFSDTELEQLNVPDRFEPTYQCCDSSCETFFPDDCPEQESAFGARKWFVDFADLNGKGWVPLVAALPAILAFLLLFLDNGITWHLVNHPNNKLQHGEAYNYDLCLSGIFNFINGCLGLPWLVATTVPCIVHLNSLTENDREGKVISVQETRLTNFFAHLMVGLSLLVLEVLQLLPLPVLFGVFLFMGLSALPAMQFWNRILLWFMQPSKYPDYPFTRYMQKSRIHLYTIIQLFFFGLVFTVQNTSAISIIFPLMTLLCIPGRTHLLPRFFAGWELCILDGDDEEIKEWVTRKRRSMRSSLFRSLSDSELSGAGSEEIVVDEA